MKRLLIRVLLIVLIVAGADAAEPELTKLRALSWTAKQTIVSLVFEDGTEIAMSWEDGRKMYEELDAIYGQNGEGQR